jgi:NitT/TauT family transport system substrate-binding protein
MIITYTSVIQRRRKIVASFGWAVNRRGGRAVALFAAALVLVACGQSGSEPSADTDGASASVGVEKSELLIGILPISAHLPAFAAKKLGYFEEAGLDVTLQPGQSGAAMLPLAIQGDLDVAQVPVDTVVLARTQGLNFKLMPEGVYQADTEPPGQTALVVKKDSGIDEVSDLEGKRIAVNALNSVNYLYLVPMLKDAGVEKEDVEFVVLPFPAMQDALVNGQVDAIDTTQPFLYNTEKTGQVEVLEYLFIDEHPGAPISAFGVSDQFAEENPRTLVAIRESLARATDYLNENPDEAIALAAEFIKADPALVAGAGVPPLANEIEPDAVQQVIDLMLEVGVLERSMDAEEVLLSDAESK